MIDATTHVRTFLEARGFEVAAPAAPAVNGEPPAVNAPPPPANAQAPAVNAPPAAAAAELEAPPAPPVKVPAAARAMLPVFQEAAGRVLRREAKALEREGRRHAAGDEDQADAFRAWARVFYAEHRTFVLEVFRPIVLAFGSVLTAAGMARAGVAAMVEEVEAFGVRYAASAEATAWRLWRAGSIELDVRRSSEELAAAILARLERVAEGGPR